METTTNELYASLFLVYGVCALAPFAALVLALARVVRHLSRAISEREGAAVPNPLETGPVTLEGNVDVDDPGSPIISHRIEQEGEAIVTTTAPYHRWTEVHRELSSRPFRLILPSGAHVRVEPGNDVRLIHEITRTERKTETRRYLVSEILHGERVFVRGELEKGEEAAGNGGYRGRRQEVLTLKPPPRKALEISSEPFRARDLYWAQFPTVSIPIFIALIAWSEGAVYRDFNRLMLSGVVTTAEIVSIKKASGRAEETLHDVVLSWRLANTEEPSSIVKTVGENVAQTLSVGQSISIRALPSDPGLYVVGKYPVASSLSEAIVVVIALLATVVVSVELRRSRLRWYEQKRVVLEEEGPLRNL